MVPARPRYAHGERPYGTAGQQVLVTVNAYEIIQRKASDFYIYDAIVTRANPNRDILVKSDDVRVPLNSQRAHEIIDRMKASYPAPWATMSAAYDGRKLIVSRVGTFAQPTQFIVNMSAKAVDDPRNFGVFVVTVARVLQVNGGSYGQLINGAGEDDDSKAFIQALQLLLRMAPILAGNGGTPHNSHSVFTPANKRPIGVYELWRGIFQSVRPSVNRLIVNVDTVAAYIYTPGMPIIEFIGRSLGIRDPRDLDRLQENTDDWRLLKTLVKRVVVHPTVPPQPANVPARRKPIRDVVVDICAFMFDRDLPSGETERMSVYDYFREVHNVTPRRKLGLQFGSNTHPMVIPAEYCIIADGQILKRSLTSDQTNEMLKFTKTRPQERMQQIQQAVTGPFLNYSQSPYIQQTGLQIAPQPIQARGRMLARPGIQFANPQNPQQPVVVNPQDDTSWRIVDKTFVSTGKRSCWAVVNFSDARNEQVMQFARQLQQRCAARGMDVVGLTAPVIAGNNQAPGASLDAALNQYHAGQQGHPPQSQMMVLVVLPRNNHGGEQRKAAKFWGDCVRGVVTQCMKQEKVQQNGGQLDQYCNNMAVKINAKLGGTNSLPRSGPVTSMLHKGRFIVFGADVGHPGPSVMDRPSICSLTASIDPNATRYISRAFIQHPRQETMDPIKLENMVYDCILACAQRNNAVPANLLFYRDGVSEGEFEKVSIFEIPAIEKAWVRFWMENYDVMKQNKVQFVPESKKAGIPTLQLTFVVVGKRHHFKFFPNEGTPSDKSGNVRGGLVVDRDIVAPTSLDFYLQSHGGLLGTSRSSHYTVLANTTINGQGMGIDELQAVSHYLCYAYARATRAVSIPAPVYYADLICARARFHLNDSGQAFSEGGSGDFDESYWNNIFQEVHQAQRNRPFFM